MKIVYGITKSNFGGAQRYVFDLATQAKQAGHDVAVICGGNGPLVQKLESNHIRVITLPHLERDISLFKEFHSFHFLLKTLSQERPDVFHTNSSKMGGLGNLSARLVGVNKIFFTGHGWAFSETWRPCWQRAVIKFFHWVTIMLSHKTICVSEETRRGIAHWPFVKNRLVVIRNGISELDLKPREEARQKLVTGIAQETLLVGSTSELHKVKGLDILLTAWKKFVEKNKAHLVLIGAGEERDNLEKMANNLGITDSITFSGYVDDARSYLSALDIFVIPSRSENLPYAILEAGLSSLPVVASRVGGIPEIIEAGTNGVLAEKEDAQTLTSSLLLLAEDAELRRRLGKALYETISKDFSISKMYRETTEAYTT